MKKGGWRAQRAIPPPFLPRAKRAAIPNYFIFDLFFFILNSFFKLLIRIDSYHSLERYDEALPVARQAHEWSKKTTGDKSALYADCVGLLAIVLHDKTDYPAAELLYLEALDLRKSLLGIRHKTTIHNINNLAVLYDDMGLFDKAEPLYLQVKEARKETLGEWNEDYASALNNLAILYKSTNRMRLAEPLYLQAIAIREKVDGAESPEYARSLNNLANLYGGMDLLEKAEPLYLKALNIYKKVLGEEHPAYAGTLNNLGVLYRSLQRYKQAEPLLLQAAEIRKKALGEDNPNYIGYLMNIALLYQDMRHYERAESILKQVLRSWEKSLGKENPNYLMALGSLADLYRHLKQYDKAEQLLLESNQGRLKLFGSQSTDYALGLNMLAELYKDTARYPLAEALYLQAADIFKQQLGEKHQDYQRNLNNLVGLYLLQKDFEKSKKLCYSILNIEKQDNALLLDSLISDNANQETIKTLEYLSDTYTHLYLLSAKQDKGALQNAYHALQTAIKINEKKRNDFTAEQDKLRLLSLTESLAAQAISVGSSLDKEQLFPELFSVAELNKSALLADALKSNRARTWGGLPDSLATQEKTLQEALGKLKKEEALAQTIAEKSKITDAQNKLNLEIEALKKQLKSNFPQYHALRYEQITAKTTEVQNLLDKETLFLEFFVPDDSSAYLFAIDKQHRQLFSYRYAVGELERHIKQLREALTDYEQLKNQPEENYKNYSESAFWLYNTLLKSVLDKYTSSRHLIIVTDGALGHLPFEVFLRQQAPEQPHYADLHYLIKDFTINYNYSATLWKENLQNPKKQNNGQIFAFAASYNNKAATQRAAGALRPELRSLRDGLAELPAARTEVEGLAHYFTGDFRFGADANEHYFKAKAADYGVVHLAMHGILNQRQPILSSLAFSETNDSLEDNFLEAWEVAQLRLNADLVVLSACETGYGRFERGEGVLSLARSFMYAGAPALVVSLWSVNDASTAEIMQYFYQNLAQGNNKAEALRQAKLSYLAQAKGLSAHPAYWSPFVQLGDTAPLHLQQKGGGSYWWYWLVGGGVLLLGAAVYVLKKYQH